MFKLHCNDKKRQSTLEHQSRSKFKGTADFHVLFNFYFILWGGGAGGEENTIAHLLSSLDLDILTASKIEKI